MNSPHTILVVDDERQIEQMFKRKFRKREDIKFVFAFDGHDALQKLEKHPDIKIILTDINMPKMDGIELLQHLADDGFHGQSIVVTAYNDYNRLLSAINQGASGFLGKPINFGELEKLLARTIRQQLALQNKIFHLESNLETAAKKVERLEALNIELNVEVLKLRGEIQELHEKRDKFGLIMD